MRRPRAFAAAAALGVLLGVTPAAVPAGAQESAPEPQIVAVGWWTRSATQQAPKGGIAVATAPDGPVTVAAISVNVGEADVFTATLEAVETGGFAQEASSIQACYTANNAWEPTEGGSLDEAPEPACGDDSVLLTRDGDARTWSGELAQLFAGKTGTVSIMLVPGDEPSQSAPPAPPAPGVPPPPPPSVAPAFDVRLAEPALDAEASELSEGGSGIIGSDDDSDTFSSSSDGGSSSSADSSSVPATGEGSYTPPPAAEPSAPPSDAAGGEAAAADDAGDASADEGAGDRQAFQPLGAAGGDGRPWGQAVLYVLIAAVLGTGAALGRWVLRERLL